MDYKEAQKKYQGWKHPEVIIAFGNISNKILDLSEMGNLSEEDKNKILIKDVNGVKIAFLSYTYGTNGIALPKDMPYAVDLLNEGQVAEDLCHYRDPFLYSYSISFCKVAAS